MSMPPSGVLGGMNEDAIIEAEIQQQLEHIGLDAIDDNDDDVDVVDDEVLQNTSQDEEAVPGEVSEYLKKIQEQTSRFELELAECDDLLQPKDKPPAVSNALIPYEDHQLLEQLTRESGCQDIEEYKRKILEELDNDDLSLDDDLAADGSQGESTLAFLTEGGEVNSTNVSKSETVSEQQNNSNSEIPNVESVEDVSTAVVPVHPDWIEIQKQLKQQMMEVDRKYKEREMWIKKDEALKRDELELQERRLQEQKQLKLQEIEREEQQLQEQRQVQEMKLEEEEKEQKKKLDIAMEKLQKEMSQLESQTRREQVELEMSRVEEDRRQKERRNAAATKIQRTFRGYCVRKDYKSVLCEKRDERKRIKEEERIKEVEKEIERRKEEIQNAEEAERQKEEEKKRLAEEKKQKEEEERKKKELEKKLKEEEKRRKKEEEEQRKLEEKRRKEEEKLRLEEEKKRKKEEERQRKEAEKLRKEEEERKKKEEKKQREEEEKRRKEEEKQREEEEKRRKEEDKKKKEEEKRLKEEEEKRLKEEAKKAQEELERKKKEKEKEVLINNRKLTDNSGKENESSGKSCRSEGTTGGRGKETQTARTNTPRKIISSKDNVLHNGSIKSSMDRVVDSSDSDDDDSPPVFEEDVKPKLSQTQKGKTKGNNSARGPSTPRKGGKPSESQKFQNSGDCLPEHLEGLRLAWMKDCLPWSKVSNEPWKLKPGGNKKPLRRPSSAKKLPMLAESLITEAAHVATLRQVTTVRLEDLPGYNMSPLGQCWGLKYLCMTHCNLVSVEGLHQCKQLQYVELKHNKIEFVDLKDLGNLQFVDLSHNHVSAVHGLDNCTNLRWLDISHNRITRIGGLDSLRRLHTLKASHNQLLSSKGLSDTPTLQVIDLSHNHLQSVEDLHKLCLLVHLDVSGNNLLKLPVLQNHVLLQELLLEDNSITSLEELSRCWLPVLRKLNIAQNSITEVGSIGNCLVLQECDLNSNQLIDADSLQSHLGECLYIEHLCLEGNPVYEEVGPSNLEVKLRKVLPRVHLVDSLSSARKPQPVTPVKPRNSFEAMCMTQGKLYKDLRSRLEQDHRTALLDGNSNNLQQLSDLYFKYCDKMFKMAVEHRYAHEYGDTTITVPTAPSIPNPGRPVSARTKVILREEAYLSPKEMFERALQSSTKTPGNKTVENSSFKTEDGNNGNNVTFAEFIPTPDRAAHSKLTNGNVGEKPKQAPSRVPADTVGKVLESSSERSEHKAAMKIQSVWRGYTVRREIHENTRLWLAAITIQTAWRGYKARKLYRRRLEERKVPVYHVDPKIVEKLHNAATKIQAVWRGYNLRCKLLAALEYAHVDDSDEDEMEFGELDLDKFVNFDEGLLDEEWRPPTTPQLPQNHPVLGKPPSGHPKVPPINTKDRPPSNPRRAWRNMDSPLSDAQTPLGRVPRPPSSVTSGASTALSGFSNKKEEKLSEEWGFKDSQTAHLMMERAKKMKYNSERRKKISKLDPKQRLALFRKLEQTAHQPVQQPARKTLPRKEYFKARQDEIKRQDEEKRNEYREKVSRTYEWLHTQVGDHPVTDSVINQGIMNSNQRGGMYGSESNLPKLDPEITNGKRVHLVSSPMDLQSVESVSSVGDRARRLSTGGTRFSDKDSRLPPIKTGSAPSIRTKEKMSWRRPDVNKSIGWGGGKKRLGNT